MLTQEFEIDPAKIVNISLHEEELVHYFKTQRQFQLITRIILTASWVLKYILIVSSVWTLKKWGITPWLTVFPLYLLGCFIENQWYKILETRFLKPRTQLQLNRQTECYKYLADIRYQKTFIMTLRYFIDNSHFGQRHDKKKLRLNRLWVDIKVALHTKNWHESLKLMVQLYKSYPSLNVKNPVVIVSGENKMNHIAQNMQIRSAADMEEWLEEWSVSLWESIPNISMDIFETKMDRHLKELGQINAEITEVIAQLLKHYGIKYMFIMPEIISSFVKTTDEATVFVTMLAYYYKFSAQDFGLESFATVVRAKNIWRMDLSQALEAQKGALHGVEAENLLSALDSSFFKKVRISFDQ